MSDSKLQAIAKEEYMITLSKHIGFRQNLRRSEVYKDVMDKG